MSFALKAGLMKPRKGFTPVTGKEKTWVGKERLPFSCESGKDIGAFSLKRDISSWEWIHAEGYSLRCG
jgi:hypothetical protein